MSNQTTVSATEESKELKQQSTKDCQRKFLITISIILFVEAPQVFCAWLTIAEKMPLFRNQNSQPIEVIQHRVN
jgi:hypothetical protein